MEGEGILSLRNNEVEHCEQVDEAKKAPIQLQVATNEGGLSLSGTIRRGCEGQRKKEQHA